MKETTKLQNRKKRVCMIYQIKAFDLQTRSDTDLNGGLVPEMQVLWTKDSGK
jgi:hypothetical protein